MEQKNGSVIHDVISVKYNKEIEIFLSQLTYFPRLNKSVRTETKEHINCTYFTVRIWYFLAQGGLGGVFPASNTLARIMPKVFKIFWNNFVLN